MRENAASALGWPGVRSSRGEKKTDSASVMLADNLPASAANRQKAVHGAAQWSSAGAPSRASEKFHGVADPTLAYVWPLPCNDALSRSLRLRVRNRTKIGSSSTIVMWFGHA